MGVDCPWLLFLRKERGVKIDRRTHSYNKVAATEEGELFLKIFLMLFSSESLQGQEENYRIEEGVSH